MRPFLLSLVVWPIFVLILLVAAIFLWMLVAHMVDTEIGWGIVPLGGLSLFFSTLSVYTLKTAVSDLREKWAQVQAGLGQGMSEAMALATAPAIVTPWGAVGQLLLVVYLFTVHPLWQARIEQAGEGSGRDALSLGLIVLAIGLEHWGCDGLLRSLPARVSGRKASLALGWLALFVLRVGFLFLFLQIGLAGVAGYLGNGVTPAVTVLEVLGVTVIMLKEAWLFRRVGRRSADAEIPPVLFEAAHWLGTLAMVAMVEVYYFDAPFQGSGRSLILALTALPIFLLMTFTPIWAVLQFPHLVRHLHARTTIRQEIAWWGSTLALFVAVGERVFWS